VKRFQLLEEEEIKTIHEATLEILEKIGIRCKSEKFREVLADNGCKVEGEWVKFPPEVVERFLQKVPAEFKLYGRDGKTVLEIGKKHAYAQNCSGTPRVVDLDTGERREYVLQDLADMTRLIDALPNIHIVSCGVPTDVEEQVYMVVEIATMLRNTMKPVRLPIESAAEMKYICELLSLLAGSMEQFRQKPFLYLEVSPLSPLDYAREPADLIIALAEEGIPVGIIPCPMMGATGPMTLIGSVAQHNAEIVAGVVAAEMVNPGVPVMMSPRVTFMDMRSGLGLWAAPETGLAGVCSAQLANYYNIPVSVSGYSAAAQVADQQSGYERCYNALLNALVGVDVLAAAGALDNCLTQCYVQLVLDDEISSMVRSTFRKLDVAPETLAVDVVAEVISTKGSFLGHKHTRKYLRAGELWMPPVGSRLSFNEWAETKETIEDRARSKAKEILQSERTPVLDPQVEAEMDRIIETARKELTAA